MLGVIVIYVVLFGGLWWFMMRPQKKEQKRIQAMLASMEVGDTALTTSGFYGVIIDITDDDVIVEFGNNKNCRIPMQKAAIAQIEKPNAEKREAVLWPEAVEQLFLNRSLWNSQSSLCFLALLCGKGLK